MNAPMREKYKQCFGGRFTAIYYGLSEQNCEEMNLKWEMLYE